MAFGDRVGDSVRRRVYYLGDSCGDRASSVPHEGEVDIYKDIPIVHDVPGGIGNGVGECSSH
jgi:hypothetical protein